MSAQSSDSPPTVESQKPSEGPDIPALVAARDRAAEVLADADKELQAALGAAELHRWQRERACAQHAEVVRARAKAIREEQHPGWDSEPGGTIVRDPATGRLACAVLDECTDQAESELDDVAPDGWSPSMVKRQGPGAQQVTMSIPPDGYRSPSGVPA